MNDLIELRKHLYFIYFNFHSPPLARAMNKWQWFIRNFIFSSRFSPRHATSLREHIWSKFIYCSILKHVIMSINFVTWLSYKIYISSWWEKVSFRCEEEFKRERRRRRRFCFIFSIFHRWEWIYISRCSKRALPCCCFIVSEVSFWLFKCVGPINRIVVSIIYPLSITFGHITFIVPIFISQRLINDIAQPISIKEHYLFIIDAAHSDR